MMNITDSFIEKLFDMRMQPLSGELRLQVKKCMLDYLGTALTGSLLLRDRTEKYLDIYANECGQASVIGTERKTSALNAALLNGINAHVTELDDGHRYCIMHPGAPVFSALLSVAQSMDVEPERFMLSVAVGYEAAIRLAMSVQPGHKEMGYHATGTCATAGAAMGVACALNLDRTQTKNALSAAVVSMSGLLELLEDNSDLKPYNAGKAAMNGLVSANLALSGFTGPDDILGGKRGFFAVMSKNPDLTHMTREVGKPQYGIEGIYMKPYAACRYAHAPIQAALTLQKRHNLKPDEIDAVKVETFNYAVAGHDSTDVTASTPAKMSIPYSVATALVTGGAGVEAFLAPWLGDPRLQKLTKKVTVCGCAELTAMLPDVRAARVCICARGQTYIEQVDYPYGEPENPLTNSDVEDKYISLASYCGRSKEQTRSVIHAVWNLEDRFAELLEML